MFTYWGFSGVPLKVDFERIFCVPSCVTCLVAVAAACSRWDGWMDECGWFVIFIIILDLVVGLDDGVFIFICCLFHIYKPVCCFMASNYLFSYET